MDNVHIDSDMIKLDQLLKWASIAESGAMAKHMILNGLVKVNGEVVLQRGKKIYKGDRITIENMGEFVVL